MEKPLPIPSAILLVGNELLSGRIEDKNGSYFGSVLKEEGFEVKEIRVVGDDPYGISRAVKDFYEEYPFLLVLGGLGPTQDDRTTEGIASAFHTTLSLHSPSWERIVDLFSKKGITPPPENKKQAMIPVGAEVLENPAGTAPGYFFFKDGKVVVVLPGPPKENRVIFSEKVKPFLSRWFPKRSPLKTHTFRVFGCTESEADHLLRDLPLPSSWEIQTLFQFPEILISVVMREKVDTSRSRKVFREIRKRLSPYLYGEGEKKLPEKVGEMIRERGWKLVTVESCTGGLLGKLLTDIPGSSAWFYGGFVVYDNSAKKLLGVSSTLLKKYGAVSEEVALDMLRQGLRSSRQKVGISITGIAGPSGGTPSKPVGTVCIAWGNLKKMEVKTYRFPWDREYNRIVSAWTALWRLRLWMKKESVSS